MDTTKNTTLESLREMVCSLVSECIDEDLLDLIGKLLMQPSGS